jgi:hypothetical protein
MKPLHLEVATWLRAGRLSLVLWLLGCGAATAADIGAVAPAWPARPNAAIIEAAIPSADIAGLDDQLEKAVLKAMTKAGGGLDWSAVGHPLVLATLEQHELIARAGEEAIANLAHQEGGQELLKALLTDPAWVEMLLVAGTPEASYGAADLGFAKAMDNLRVLYRYGKDLDKPVYRRLATAMALHSGGLPWRLVTRFKEIQAAHRQGLLHANFDTLDAREMGWATYLGYGEGNAGDLHEYPYLLDERQQKIGDYINACWAVWWLDFNVYGDWLQGPDFYKPWMHVFGRREEAAKKIGGQCEDLSRYGWATARAHGVMAGLAGQPGHCAYVVRMDERWPIAYDVCGPAVTDFRLPGWEGTSYATTTWLYEPVQHDRAHFLAANRLDMAAKLLSEQAGPRVRIVPGLKYAIYREGVGASLPDFSKLTPAIHGTARGIHLEAIKPSPPTNFGAVWVGQIEVTAAGSVRVVLRSDDQSRLWLDGHTVLETSCARQEKLVALTAGRHDLRLEYCQAGGPYDLDVQFRGIRRAGAWMDGYGRAVRAQPLNYRTWLDYVEALESTAEVAPKTWQDLGASAVDTFAPYQDAAWSLAQRIIKNVLPAMPPAERRTLFESCHRKLRQDHAKQYEGYRFDNVLEWQANQLGDRPTELKFFAAVLAIHAAPPPNDRLFGTVLEWGRGRFTQSDPQTAAQFADLVGVYFRAHGGAGEKNLLRSQIESGIRTAAERGDFAAARTWMGLARELLPPVQPGDVFLSPEQARGFPEVAPFAGQLLSADGVLRVSTNSPNDRPLTYTRVLGGAGFGGLSQTGDEQNPWVQVQLPGDGSLTGIVLVNRYEASDAGQVSLKVSVSADGKAWVEVAAFDKAEKMFRVDLKGKDIRARYVRVERPGEADKRVNLALRAVWIYGQRLY